MDIKYHFIHGFAFLLQIPFPYHFPSLLSRVCASEAQMWFHFYQNVRVFHTRLNSPSEEKNYEKKAQKKKKKKQANDKSSKKHH